jgi:hemerythrin HHE cation binding domain-containing protein
MTFLEKAFAALAPAESETARIEARGRALAAAAPGDWLSLVLDHHLQIESAFVRLCAARNTAERGAALNWLCLVLSAHADAEESVLYPMLAEWHGQTYPDSTTLKALELGTKDCSEKVEQLRAEVAHHIYEEEATWFLDLHHILSPGEQARLTTRYRERFEFCMGHDRAA